MRIFRPGTLHNDRKRYRRMRSLAKFLLVAVCVPMFGAGCIIPVGPDDLRLQVSRANDVALEQEIGVSVDGLTLATAAAVAGVPLPLIHVGWAEIGIYRIAGGANADAPVREFAAPELEGWQRVVRLRERDSKMHMLVKPSGGGIRGMIMVARSGDEVIVVRVRGRLHKLLEYVIAHSAAKDGFPRMFDAFDLGSNSKRADTTDSRSDEDEVTDCLELVSVN